MKTFVIGDTHGCFGEFEDLMTKLGPNLKSDKLIMLGDYIDRGPQSWEMLQEIIHLHETYGESHVILLRGNHEQMAIDFLLSQENSFLFNGGNETLTSLKRHNGSLEHYLDFFTNMALYHEDEDFIYVHGGIEPGVSMPNQKQEVMLWIRDEFYGYPNTTGKTVIFGHTPTLFINNGHTPIRMHNNYALDTGCVYGGCLSALEIDQGQISHVYQIESKRASLRIA
ncbi:phosphoprotein phosphatase [Acididesulfobacillus acetoxydans]|uniref:Phosphoprotein phosphatase n=1 Tax=Acididesulfobacillus acetoxydans TaxID=1561005 RepID=A0A8S0WIA7_9FIRM|nr:metallophosphoesterase family protein [Acididesulfobacillus acetoxydans]CAA7603212.1 phosphoprotein phosphatase [Acididesulfobacillus acetoxydans]